jgi:hypothetical protein
MKAFEILQQVKDLCLYSTTGTSRDNMILQRLNMIQSNLYNTPRFWKGLEGYQDLSTTASTAYNSVPADVGVIYDMRQMTVSPYSKLIYIHPHLFHEIVPQPTTYATNKPRYYTWWGGRIWWYPIPDATYTITMYYYKKPTDMKIYASVGTSAVAGTAVTGTSTKYKDNANVDTSMYFTMTADALSNGLYPWALVKTITDNTNIVLDAAYTGASSTTAAYAFSSLPTFPSEFDSYLIYSATLQEIGRLREMSELRGWLKEQINEILPGLIRNQTYLPDWTPEAQNFNQQPIILGDDYARFPFIGSNP